MKDKILVFIIGLLIGAVITASGFLIYEKNNQNTTQVQNQEKMQMMERPDGETPPERPDGETPPERPDGETPPERPDGETPPEKPDGADNNENRPEPPSRNDTSKENKTN